MSDGARINKNDASGRRLAAILHADVVGYSASVATDEAKTLADLRKGLELAETIVSSHAGRIVSTAGDAFLAEFASVVDAVAAGMDFQKQTATGQHLKWRIGLNLGDIVVETDDIYGDGVNVAARVQALAPPGGIALTAAVRDQEGGRLGIDYLDLGVQTLKNVPKPVHVFAVKGIGTPVPSARRRGKSRVIAALMLCIGLATLAVWTLLGPRDDTRTTEVSEGLVPTTQPPVVAVLPFRDEMAATEETWFADGLTGEVIRQLGRFPSLFVLSWNAVEPYRANAQLDVLEHDLKADFVVNGMVWRNDETLRLNVDLSDIEGRLIWSERYDTDLSDIFAVQDDVANAIVGSLAVGLSRDVERRAQQVPTGNLDAYDLYLRGRVLIRKTEREANFEARKLFARAITLDASFSDAEAGLAWTHVADAWWGWSEWPYDSIDLALDRANKAIALNPRNGFAHSIRSEALWMRQEFAAALAESERALELNPNDAWALATHGGLLLHTGNPADAIAPIEQAFRLNPNPPSWAFANLGMAYYLLGRDNDALELLTCGSSKFKEDPSPHAILAMVAHRDGHASLAKSARETALRLSPFFDPAIYASSFGGGTWQEQLEFGLREAGFQ